MIGAVVITFRTAKKMGGVGREFSPKMREAVGKISLVKIMNNEFEIIFQKINLISDNRHNSGGFLQRQERMVIHYVKKFVKESQ